MTHNFRKGDVVTVRTTVRYGSDIAGDGRVSLDLGYSGVTVDVDDIEVIQPYLAIGDVVTTRLGYPLGQVRGVVADNVWVEHVDGEFGTYAARDLRLADYPTDPILVDPTLIETPPYASPGTDEHGKTLADRASDLPHLAEALADA